MKKLKTALLFGLIVLAGSMAKAGDILLIDVNNVVPEIDLIREFLRQEQAQGRELNTRLVIVPSEERLPMETRRKIHQLHAEVIDPNSIFYRENCFISAMNANPKLAAKCEKARSIFAPNLAIAERMIGGSNANGEFVVEEILAELKEVLRGPYQFDRVLISGHHGSDVTSGQLSGELYSGLKSGLVQEILNSAPSTQDVRSLIMLGCWTGREDMMKNAWGRVLPQAPFHLGFVEKAPAKANPTNLMILESILRNEKTIGESQTESELRQSYSKLRIADRRVAVKVKDMYISPSGLKRLR